MKENFKFENPNPKDHKAIKKVAKGAKVLGLAAVGAVALGVKKYGPELLKTGIKLIIK